MQSIDAQALLDRTETTLILLMLLAAVVPTTILAAITPSDYGSNETIGV